MSDKDLESSRAAYRAHQEYGGKKPEWMQLALNVINAWGRGQVTLVHGIAMAMELSYELGTQGEYPEVAQPVSTVVRRKRPGVAPTVIRRRR